MQNLDRWTTNEHLKNWIKEIVLLTEPKDVHLVDGTEDEYQGFIRKLEESKTVVRLNPKLRPNSYLARSNPDDVARVEDRTFICSENEADAGPTNNWKAPAEMKEKLLGLFKGSMKGRTLYVVPYCMGPLNSPWSKVAVEITDSAYVVANMKIMTRIGKDALKVLGNDEFVKCLHSVGQPLQNGEKDSAWPCNPAETYIVHFPEKKEVWSFGSGYGGNALLNKKCFALRLASVMAKNEGWLAEHMLIIGVTNPKGIKKYFTGSFPSACGKTNLAMLQSSLPGWKIECVGDDIAWMHWGKDGRLYAINPEAGFFGVAPGTSNKSNPNAMKSIEKNTLFTNVALTDDGDVWWEGMTDEPPKHLISWLGEDWTPASQKKAAHPNARFTAPVAQCPSVDPDSVAPLGVPISGIIFGGRRSTCMPLVRECLSWQHGVFLGASMTSETTAAAKGEVGKLRHDPFSMLPFCGYHMGDYFAHWLKQDKPGHKLPKIYYVNWFLKDSSGKFVWPGFGENIRVLKWMFERSEDQAQAEKTPIGSIPTAQALDIKGLEGVSFPALFTIDKEAWKAEVKDLESYFATFGKKLPQGITDELNTLKAAF
jgi:phosphoenolpyruvate carboxykinase (GTP)